MQYILLRKFGDKLGVNLEKGSGFDRAYSAVFGSLYEREAQLFCIKRELDVILKERGINMSLIFLLAPYCSLG